MQDIDDRNNMALDAVLKCSINSNRIYIAPNIPSKKLNNAINVNAFARESLRTSSEEVILLIDDTFFGSAKQSVLITTNGIYAKFDFEDPHYVQFKNIARIYNNKSELYINDVKFCKFILIESSEVKQLCEIIKSISKAIYDYEPKGGYQRGEKSDFVVAREKKEEERIQKENTAESNVTNESINSQLNGNDTQNCKSVQISSKIEDRNNMALDAVLKCSINSNRIYIAPNIPSKKLNNAINVNAFARESLRTSSEEVLLLIDDTFFGSAKQSVLITTNGIYAKFDFEDPLYVHFKNIGRIYNNKSELYINDVKFCKFILIESSDLKQLCEIIKSISKAIYDYEPKGGYQRGEKSDFVVAREKKEEEERIQKENEAKQKEIAKKEKKRKKLESSRFSNRIELKTIENDPDDITIEENLSPYQNKDLEQMLSILEEEHNSFVKLERSQVEDNTFLFECIVSKDDPFMEAYMSGFYTGCLLVMKELFNEYKISSDELSKQYEFLLKYLIKNKVKMYNKFKEDDNKSIKQLTDANLRYLSHYDEPVPVES